MSERVIIDVRPTIKSGNDPFNEIMAVVKTLPAGTLLQVINIFEPIPLINKLTNDGFESWTERPEDGVVHTFFKKSDDAQESDKLPSVEQSDSARFDEKLASFGKKKHTIDVRYLEMPEPMVTILSALEKLPDDHVLFVEHKQMPKFLLTELKTRNYEISINEVDADNLQLLIYKS